MRRDLMQKAAENVLPSLKFEHPSGGAPGKSRLEPRGPDTKTTILAFRYSDGIMCAADRKVSGGWFHIHSQDMVKMWQVSSNSVMLGCGSVGQIQTIRDVLRRRCSSFQRSFGHAISVDGQAKIVARCCQWHSIMMPDSFSFGAMLAGVNRNGEFRIIAIEEDASRMLMNNYDAMGSGGGNAKVALDKGRRPDLDLEAARALAVEAIFHAANRDSGSSPLQVAMPTLATVTSDGIAKVTDAVVMEVAAQVLLQKLGIHVDLARAIARQGRRKP